MKRASERRKSNDRRGKPTVNAKDHIASSRLDLSLVPSTAIAFAALQFTEGHGKYGGFNWRVGGVQASIYIGAMQRHIASYADGEFNTPEGGTHLGGILACASILVDAHVCGILLDDRPPSAPTGELIRSLEEKVKHFQKLYGVGPGRFTELNKKTKKQAYR